MKKKIFKYLQINVVPFVMQLFVRLIYLTNKKTFHYPENLNDDSYIILFWHGDLLMQPLHYAHFRPNGYMKAIISEHRDGETIRKIVKYLGTGSFDGSSTRGGVKALIGAMKAIKNKDADVAITPDGPKGPIYSIADGAVAISQKTKTKILPFSSIPSSYWQMKSWDKFIIPKPFGTINFYIGEPFEINNLKSEDAKELIFNKLMQNQLKK
jgi:lysophospholipid acyltransferase (LPLAT)-like uncharacterized protein